MDLLPARGRGRHATTPAPIAISVSASPLIAITVAMSVSTLALNLSRAPQPGCRQPEHGPPMIAISRPDVCERLQVRIDNLHGRVSGIAQQAFRTPPTKG